MRGWGDGLVRGHDLEVTFSGKHVPPHFAALRSQASAILCMGGTTMNPVIRFTTACLSIWLTASGSAIAQSRQGTDLVVVRRGTALKFWLVNSLDSNSAKIGDDVPLRLARPLKIDGVTLLQPGVLAHGKMKKVKRAGPNCAIGNVVWRVDSIVFPDLSKADTEKLLEVRRQDYDPPDSYPGRAIQKGRHDFWRWIVFSPLLAIEVPILYVGMSENGGKCHTRGKEYTLPADATIVVVIAKDHHVHF